MFAVRSVIAEDFNRWLPLWDAYNEFYGRVGESSLPKAITQTTWERFFDCAEPVHAIVAESNGELIALAHYLFHRSTISPSTCYLQDLFTTQRARGRGVGRALVEVVYERAQAAGSTRVYWQTHESNRTAMRLYDGIAERSGFVVYRKALQ